jgi:hypothetical protein
MTVAHLVNKGEQLSLVFGNGTRALARCVDRSKALDAALLALEKVTPADGLAPPLAVNTDGDFGVGAQWRTWGHPEGFLSGYVVGGTVAGLSSSMGVREIFLRREKDPEKKLKGISGGPVVDRFGVVVGILKESPRDLLGMSIGSRLDDVRRALRQWHELAPDLRSDGPVSRYLERYASVWGKLPGHDRQLATVFVRQRFRRAATGRDRGASGTIGLQALLDQLRTEQRHLVLRGDPGSGKTVLLQWLCAEAAQAWQKGNERREVPILIHASKLAEVAADVDRAIVDVDASGLFAGSPPDDMRWLVLIDGLDEIVDVEQRERALRRIKERAGMPPGQRRAAMRIVLASRPLAILDEIPESMALHLVLRPFDTGQLEAFANNWFRGARVGAGATEFLGELRASRLDELVATPALATVAATVFERAPDKQLPRRRSDLYDAFVEASLKGRDPEISRRFLQGLEDLFPGRGREIGGTIWEARDAMATALASQVQDGRLPPTGGDFVAAAIQFMAGKGMIPAVRPGSEREHRLSLLVYDLLVASGLFVRAADGKLAFFHNTLREALTARDTASAPHGTPDEIWAVVRRWIDVRWREIVLLVLARWSQEGGETCRSIWSVLQPVVQKSNRGKHFVATALGEGMVLERDAEEAVINTMLERLEHWSPCAELFSEFQSPNPVDALRALSRRPLFVGAMVDKLSQENRCAIKISALAELTLELGSVEVLAPLLRSNSKVASAAAVLIARAGRLDLALPQLTELIHSTGDHPTKFQIVKLIGEEGGAKTMRDFASDLSMDRDVRLFALSYAAPRLDSAILQTLAKELADGLTLSPFSQSDMQLAGRLLLNGWLDLVDARDPGTRLAMVRAKLDAGERLCDADRRFMRRLARKADISSEVLTAVLTLLEAEPGGEDLRLAIDLMDRCEDAEHKLTIATAITRTGHIEPLVRLSESPPTKLRAANSLAQAGYDAEARAILERMAEEPELDYSELGEAFLKIGAPVRATEMFREAARQGKLGALRSLFNAGYSGEIASLIRAPEVDYRSRRFGIRCLGQLGAMDRLLEIAADPVLEPTLRLDAVGQAEALGWISEAEAARRGIETEAGYQADTLWKSTAEAIRRMVANPMVSTSDIAMRLDETYDQKLLPLFLPLLDRSDLSPEQATAALEKIGDLRDQAVN